MEGESPEFEPAAPPEREPQAFLRVELDEENKFFVKACAECGQEFRTAVPRKFFRNPNDESIRLAANGSGTIDGYDSIRADVVAEHIIATVCPDTKRNAEAKRGL